MRYGECWGVRERMNKEEIQRVREREKQRVGELKSSLITGYTGHSHYAGRLKRTA